MQPMIYPEIYFIGLANLVVPSFLQLIQIVAQKQYYLRKL